MQGLQPKMLNNISAKAECVLRILFNAINGVANQVHFRRPPDLLIADVFKFMQQIKFEPQ